MTATTTVPGQRTFDPDHYLDCRKPGWDVYEDRGLVRFERPMGSSRSLVFVDERLHGGARGLASACESRGRGQTLIRARLVQRGSRS